MKNAQLAVALLITSSMEAYAAELPPVTYNTLIGTNYNTAPGLDPTAVYGSPIGGISQSTAYAIAIAELGTPPRVTNYVEAFYGGSYGVNSAYGNIVLTFFMQVSGPAGSSVPINVNSFAAMAQTDLNV